MATTIAMLIKIASGDMGLVGSLSREVYQDGSLS
jgi:hypothetical protein